MSVYRVLLCKYEPREHILSERGVCLLKYLVVYRFFDTINCLSTNTQQRFFYAKTYCFRADFSLVPVEAAICRPQKCVAFSYIFTRNTIAAKPRKLKADG